MQKKVATTAHDNQTSPRTSGKFVLKGIRASKTTFDFKLDYKQRTDSKLFLLLLSQFTT